MTRRSLRDRNASAIAAGPIETETTPAAKQPKALTAGPEAAQGPASPPVAPKSKSKRPKKATRPVGEGRLVLWTPEKIRGRMQTEQRTSGKRYLDQILDAIEATYEHLPDLVASGEKAQAIQGSIFERVVETEHDRRVQLTIRGLLDSQLDIIDQLVVSSGAASRSALVNAALDANLPS